MKEKIVRGILGLALTTALPALAGCAEAPSSVEAKQIPYDGKLTKREFSIAGQVKGKPVEYFFYQIEDGHKFLGEGTIHVFEDNTFRANISLDVSPSNGFGGIYLYADENGDGAFTVTADTFTELGMVPLAFDETIVKR
ncbi:hypothetical protein MO973_11670 [Paenibacillus sp. TRM 82003]|nr:hypothetical protein [Paenibacillus sp. TRM 82003]